tara:strand:+ start:1003 stop:1170 length:168 start_codon:yes stop_codon:yes gene_type:complete
MREALQETMYRKRPSSAEERPFGEAALACQWSRWQGVRQWQNRNVKERCADVQDE